MGENKNLILGGIALVAIVGAVVFFTRGGGGGEAEVPDQYQINGVCLSCQKESESMHALGTYEPYECPHCQEMAVYPWWYCFNCNNQFIPQLFKPDPDSPPRFPPSPHCPICRSGNVAQYDPRMPNQSPVGQAKLPHWRKE
jgi:hypothetical protein